MEQNIDGGECFKPEVDEGCLEDLKGIKCLEDAKVFEKDWKVHINDSKQLRKYLKALKKGYTHELIKEGVLSKPDKSKLSMAPKMASSTKRCRPLRKRKNAVSDLVISTCQRTCQVSEDAIN